MIAVAGAQRLPLAALRQPLEPVLAHRLEQPVARHRRSRSSATTSDLSTSGPAGRARRPAEPVAGADLLGRLEGPAPGEDGQTARQRPLRRRRAGRGSSPSPRAASAGAGARARAAGEQAEAVRPAGGDCSTDEDPDARGGHSIASGIPSRRGRSGDRRRVPRPSAKPGGTARGALDEQPHGVVHPPARRRRPRIAGRQRRDPPGDLAGGRRGPRGWSPGCNGAGRRAGRSARSRAAASTCSQLSSTSSDPTRAAGRAQVGATNRGDSGAREPLASARAYSVRDRLGDPPQIRRRTGAELHEPDPVRVRPTAVGSPLPAAPAGSCRSLRGRSRVSSRVRRELRRRARPAPRSRPTKLERGTGRFGTSAASPTARVVRIAACRSIPPRERGSLPVPTYRRDDD